MTATVAITGASAGIGRAAARQFAQRGDRVGLIARGKAGLEGAARDVQRAGGQALAVPADVADFAQVDAAAQQIEEALGPIDVWVNVAFTSVFAPFAEITPDEFRRVTEVAYLGFVHGTMAALARMRPRDRGAIVQVGSALGERSIPLQSAYCGAKHAINGFTSSLRCELLHDKSGVYVTVVQMPAVNTPQFSWVRSKLPRHPQPVPPIYQPEVAARGIVYAADHPQRREYLRRGHDDGDDPGQPGGPGPARQVPGQDRLQVAADGQPRKPPPAAEPVGARGQPAGRTTARTGSSTTGRIRAARSCSCPSTGWLRRPSARSPPQPACYSPAGPPPVAYRPVSQRSMQASSSSVSTGLVT